MKTSDEIKQQIEALKISQSELYKERETIQKRMAEIDKELNEISPHSWKTGNP